MNKLKKLASVLTLSLLAATSYAETKLTAASVNAVGSLLNRAGNEFKSAVSEETSSVSVNHVEGTVLGNAAQVMDQTIAGAVDVMVTDMAWVAKFHPDLAVLNWSYAFNNLEHLNSYFDSKLFKTVVEEIANETGIRVLAATASQPRYFHSRTPINRADDIAGLKVRVPQIPVFIDSWDAMGAVPTPLNFSEVFIAMKTGVIDGAFGNPSATYPNNFHKSGPYVVTTGDTIGSAAIIINEAKYQSLSSKERKAVSKAAKNTAAWTFDAAQEEMKKVVQDMINEGATIKDIDLEPLKTAAFNKGIEFESDGAWSKGLLEKIQKIK